MYVAHEDLFAVSGATVHDRKLRRDSLLHWVFIGCWFVRYEIYWRLFVLVLPT
jgi:hypothetical protein